MDPPSISHTLSVEKELPDDYVDLFRQMKDLGIKTRYSLSFWDMEYRQKWRHNFSRDRLSTKEKQNVISHM